MTCGIIARALVMAFFAINAYNKFTHATAETQKFKADYTNVVGTIKSKFGISLPAQLQPSSVNNYAYEIVYYGALLQLALAVLGVFSGLSAVGAALWYFKCAFVQLNFLNASWTNPAELEKLLLPIALLVGTFAVAWSGSYCATAVSKMGDVAAGKKRH